jgi:hypothetical protein
MPPRTTLLKGFASSREAFPSSRTFDGGMCGTPAGLVFTSRGGRRPHRSDTENRSATARLQRQPRMRPRHETSQKIRGMSSGSHVRQPGGMAKSLGSREAPSQYIAAGGAHRPPRIRKMVYTSPSTASLVTPTTPAEPCECPIYVTSVAPGVRHHPLLVAGVPGPGDTIPYR